MSPTGELIDTETVTISSEGGGWKRTQPVIRKDIRTPTQAVPRKPPTLLHVQLLGEGVAATSPPYTTPGWATTQVYPARITRHRITREKMNRHRITRVAPDLPTGGGLVFRQSSIDRFLKLEVPGIQEIPA